MTIAVTACAGDGSELPIASQIAIVGATDFQTIPAGGRIPIPLAVTVTDDQGVEVPRAGVRWSGTDVGLSDLVTVSDGVGRAQVDVTVGSAVQTYRVRAELVDSPQRAVVFSIVATAPPTLTGVTPSTFMGGDTVVLSGTLLADGQQVEVGGVRAPAIAVSALGQGMSVAVPWCLVPGQVSIRVLVPAANSNVITGSSNAISGTYQVSDSVRLVAGEYTSVDPAATQGCATFPAAGPSGAEYLIAAQSATGVAGLQADYRMRGDSAVTVMVASPRPALKVPFATRFHDFLREREAEVARLPKPPRRAEVTLAPAAPQGLAVGDRRQFKVCDKVGCTGVEDFADVTAAATYVGTHAVIYQDLNAPDGGFTESDFQQLGAVFDADLYGVATGAFGIESDVDRNGRVLILLTPIVNGLTPTQQCETSFVTGFFFAVDVDPAFVKDPRSNQSEVFYAITPDPNATVTCSHPVDRVRRLVPVTFIHELQHMISYNQHVLVRRGNCEIVWLNEGLSHLAEELAALHFDAMGDTVRFSQFAIGDVFNAYQFLRDPGMHSPLFSGGAGMLGERGAAWLFARWIVDQFGDPVIRRMSETVLTGSDNVTAATGEPFSRLLSEWFLANYVSDLPDSVLGDTAKAARLQYATWRFRSTYASLNMQAPERFDLPFPIVPLEFLGGTFDVTGVLRSGSGEYFIVRQNPGQRGFALRLEDLAGAALGGAIGARINVVRIR